MPIHYDKRDDHIVVITIDRPEARNSLDLYHFRDLAKAWKDFRYDDDLWLAIVTGVPGQFMTGADLKTYIPQVTELATKIGSGEVTEIDGCKLEDGTRAVLRNMKLYKPIVAAIDGPCVAGGMEMLGGVDIRIATPNAIFGVMEPKRGLFAGGGTTARLPRQLNFPAAMEFLLTAEAFPATRALELGLINEIVEPDELMDRALEWAHRICANAPLAVQATKESVLRGLAGTLRRGLRHRAGAVVDDLRHRGRQGGAQGVQGEARPRTGRVADGGRSTAPVSPCLIGVGQRTWHLAGDEQAPEPLDMLAEVVAPGRGRRRGHRRRAGRGREPRHRVLHELALRRPARSAGRRAGHRRPARRHYSGIGGTMPQRLLSAAAVAIVAGDLDVAVVCGAEALDTKRRLKKAGERPAWSYRHPEPPPFPFEAPFHPSEVAHEVFQAWLTFATRDVARRARLGIAPDEYRRRIGDLLAPMSAVAAANPNAWFPVAHDAAELITPDARQPHGRLPVHQDDDVDHGRGHGRRPDPGQPRGGRPAGRARRAPGLPAGLGRGPRRGVRGRARRPVAVAGHGLGLRRRRWARPGVGIDDVAHLDLYSCFSSSVHFAADALGLDPLADPRSVTVTGGLPYAGGAASNYLAHAVATMVDVLRDDPGFVRAGVGRGHAHDQAQRGRVLDRAGPAPCRRRCPARPDGWPQPATVPITDSWTGPATVATYSVVHGRDGGPEWGLVVVDLPDGSRGYGRVDDPDLLAAMEADEWVGRPVTATPDGPVNRIHA